MTSDAISDATGDVTRDAKRAPKPLTGRKVLLIAVCGFGAVIGANVALTVAALGSFPGIEVANGYVASQSFEAERAAQSRLGWRSEAAYEDGVLTVAVRDRSGAPAPIGRIEFHLGRPTTEAEDLTPHLVADGPGWRGEVDLAPGLWRLDIIGEGREGEAFRQYLTFTAPKGGRG